MGRSTGSACRGLIRERSSPRCSARAKTAAGSSLRETRSSAVRRSYRDDTLVLETEFETANGVVAVIDFMPARDRDPNLVRIVEGRRGRVRMRTELVFRFDYGSIVPWVHRTDCGIAAIAGPGRASQLSAPSRSAART